MNSVTVSPSKGLNITLWIAQALLMLMYLMAGATKLFQSIEELSKMLPWVKQLSPGLVRFIGLSELLGSLGLVLPAVLRIMPKLSPVAAIGLALIQLFAIVFHLSNGEGGVIVMNILFLLIAAFIAWGRIKKAPIEAKASAVNA